jgi:hypothetical protein
LSGASPEATRSTVTGSPGFAATAFAGFDGAGACAFDCDTGSSAAIAKIDIFTQAAHCNLCLTSGTTAMLVSTFLTLLGLPWGLVFVSLMSGPTIGFLLLG